MPDATSEHLEPTLNSNPWYALATLYGEPTARGDDELRARNRVAWNRYLGRKLSDEQRILLTTKLGVCTDEIDAFSAEDIRCIAEDIKKRCDSPSIFDYLSSDIIDFSYLQMIKYFSADGFIFPCACTFAFAEFAGVAAFREAIFFGRVSFKQATFSGPAHFEGATFYGRANFKDTVFNRRTEFPGVSFFRPVQFLGTKFSGPDNFTGANFSSWVDFRRACFGGRTNFSDAAFRRAAWFMNVEMKGAASFEAVTFSSVPPRFFGAQLHEGTVWRKVKWPPSPTTATEAGDFVDAYERLKLEMDRLKKHEDELDFFAMEMKARRVLCGDWKPIYEIRIFGKTIIILKIPVPTIVANLRPNFILGRRFLYPHVRLRFRTVELRRPAFGLTIAAYGMLCDYGRSYVRPVVGIFATIIIGALIFWNHFGVSEFQKAVGLSIANTFGVFGIRKDFIESGMINSLPSMLKAVAALQTGLGVALLFLFSLALRNRFRMK